MLLRCTAKVSLPLSSVSISRAEPVMLNYGDRCSPIALDNWQLAMCGASRAGPDLAPAIFQIGLVLCLRLQSLPNCHCSVVKPQNLNLKSKPKPPAAPCVQPVC